jgi:hypothetical protein
VAERDVLLATKLHVPQPRPGFLLRPRLLQRLTQGTALELVLVYTPAGFGKTVLLGKWARRSQRPVAWLSLDASDNDPTVFCRYVAAALDLRGDCRAGRGAAWWATAGPAGGGGDRPGQYAGGPLRPGRAGAGRLPLGCYQQPARPPTGASTPVCRRQAYGQAH